jgi:hypothetical protein
MYWKKCQSRFAVALVIYNYVRKFNINIRSHLVYAFFMISGWAIRNWLTEVTAFLSVSCGGEQVSRV